MDLQEESSRIFGPDTMRNLSSLSSSSTVFFSAAQSSFSTLSTRSENPCQEDTSLTIESLDKNSVNPDPQTLARFASTELLCPRADIPPASNTRLSELVSSTGVYNSTHHSNEYSRKSGKRGKKMGKLLEISAHPPSFSSNRLRSCDVYIGFHGHKPLLLRFTNWLRGELEAQGLSCFVTDRARCRNSRKHSVVLKAMDGSTFGVVILTKNSFKNPYTIEELKFFSNKKNLVPLYFDLSPHDCLVRDIIEKRGELWEKYGGELWVQYGGVEKEWRDAVNALSCADDWKLEAYDGKWRDCILRAVVLLALRLGRRSVVDRLTKWREKVEREEFPFPRNENFVGRKKELSELEFMLFGDVCGEEGKLDYFEIKAKSRRKNSKIEGTKMRKGKEPVVQWKESEKEIEMQNPEISQTPQVFAPESKTISKKHNRRKQRSAKIVYGKGIACVSGEPGIGKTELLLEFAYRHHQRYKMVLWIGGESRYIRQNYLNLWSFLEIDVGVESFAEKGRTKSFEEQEEAAVARVRKELMRNIPFLVIIDNLESEKDWWDHKLVMDLLPRFGGETHVIISTRLSRVMNLEPLKLSFLSGVEAMSLMQGGGIIRDQSITEIDALRVIEEKLGRLTLGLAIVGSILSELPINPSRLLDMLNRMPSASIEITAWSGRENNWLRRNTFLLQLFEVCFSIFDHADGRGSSLATRMALASGWFGPGPVPIPILSLAAHKIPEKTKRARLWRKIVRSMTCGVASSYARRSESEGVSLLLRFNMARACAKDGLVQPNGLLRLYARARGGPGTARPVVRAVIARGSIHHNPDHMWAACFLVLGFGKDPALVELRVPELLFFVKEVIVPLAVRAFATFSRCGAAVEVLRLCTEALEAADEAFVGPGEKWLDGSLCWRPVRTEAQLNPCLWQELALGRAGVLEVRAKLMARGAQFDIGDDLIRKAIFIRTSICGEDHPDTVAARETLSRITRLASGVQSRT
ncbi:disease resistance protein [Striga asiatica]|uniref:Disease resistance protein n=1 Tax=Striga asiatica TaxID=4170 RepID=A0A5A7QSP8_STRAF|nr:disease resistance protein [Striga asiatica]